MKTICKRAVQKDALRICYTVIDPYHIGQLMTLEIGDRYDFYLYRIEGKRFDYVFSIRYQDGEETRIFGELKFGIKHCIEEGFNDKVWIWLDNRSLYDQSESFLGFIADKLLLEYHNVTAIDLCLDLNFDIARKLKRLIKNKKLTTILNGKRIHNREQDRPEISYIFSGSLSKTEKYQTVNIRQKKAIRDKTQGLTLCAYNKKAEIVNSSNKKYINAYYGNPESLYRLELHLNTEDIKDYLQKYKMPSNEQFIFNQRIITLMFVESLNSLIRFEDGNSKIDWVVLLNKYITTHPDNMLF